MRVYGLLFWNFVAYFMFKMEYFSLEEDEDYNDLFITQTPKGNSVEDQGSAFRKLLK